MKSYAQTYKGIRYRSRLEATWSAVFDVLGIPFRYEPFDLAGYTPDFLLADKLLCEVKPLTWLVHDDTVIVEARENLERAGTEYGLALLGLDFASCEHRVIGEWIPLLPAWELGAGDLFPRFGVRGSRPLRLIGTQDWKRIWGMAAARVQWKPRTNRSQGVRR